MNRTRKINKKIKDLDKTIIQLNLLDPARTPYLAKVEFTFFSSVHRTFSRIDHKLDQNREFNKFKITEVIQNMFIYHKNEIKTYPNEIWEIHRYVKIKQHKPT